MEYTNFIIDFVERTRCNLEHIEERARCGDDDDVYPVTQLWNSLLWLIVVLHEDHEQRLPATPMTELYAQGWPDITIKGRGPETLRDLVRKLRNAVAHFNVEFRGDHSHEISTITLWTCEMYRGRQIKGSRSWEGQMGISELRLMALSVSDLYLNTFRVSAA